MDYSRLLTQATETSHRPSFGERVAAGAGRAWRAAKWAGSGASRAAGAVTRAAAPLASQGVRAARAAARVAAKKAKAAWSAKPKPKSPPPPASTSTPTKAMPKKKRKATKIKRRASGKAMPAKGPNGRFLPRASVTTTVKRKGRTVTHRTLAGYEDDTELGAARKGAGRPYACTKCAPKSKGQRGRRRANFSLSAPPAGTPMQSSYDINLPIAAKFVGGAALGGVGAKGSRFAANKWVLPDSMKNTPTGNLAVTGVHGAVAVVLAGLGAKHESPLLVGASAGVVVEGVIQTTNDFMPGANIAPVAPATLKGTDDENMDGADDEAPDSAQFVNGLDDPTVDDYAAALQGLEYSPPSHPIVANALAGAAR